MKVKMMKTLAVVVATSFAIPSIAAAEDDVRLRIDSTVYELEAEQVDDAEELMAAAAVYREKYDYDSDEPMLSGASVYRLEARD